MGKEIVKKKKTEEECTLDGSVDRHGRPAVRRTSGNWFAAILILGTYHLFNSINFLLFCLALSVTK